MSLSTWIPPSLKSACASAWLVQAIASENLGQDHGPLLPPALSPATLGRPRGPAGMAHIGKYR